MLLDLASPEIDLSLFAGAHLPSLRDKLQEESKLLPFVLEAIIKARNAKKINLADDVTTDELIDAIAQVAKTRNNETVKDDLDGLVTAAFKKEHGRAMLNRINELNKPANSAAAKQPATQVTEVAQNVSRQAAAGTALTVTRPNVPVEPPEDDAEKTRNWEPQEYDAEQTRNGDEPPEDSAESSGPLVPVDTGAIITSQAKGAANVDSEPESNDEVDAEITAEHTNPDGDHTAALEAEQFDVKAAIAYMLNVDAFDEAAMTRLLNTNNETDLFDLARENKMGRRLSELFTDTFFRDNFELFTSFLDDNTQTILKLLDVDGIQNIETLLRDGVIDEKIWKPFLPALTKSHSYTDCIQKLILLGMPEIGMTDETPFTLQNARSALTRALGGAHAAELVNRFSFKNAVAEYYANRRLQIIEGIISDQLNYRQTDAKKDAIKSDIIKIDSRINVMGNGDNLEVSIVGGKYLEGNDELLRAAHAAREAPEFGKTTTTKVRNALRPVEWILNEVREGIVCLAQPGTDGTYASGEIKVVSTCESGGYVLIYKDGSVQLEGDKAKLFGAGRATHLNIDPNKRQNAIVAASKVPVAKYSHILFLSKDQYAQIATAESKAGESDLDKINRILDRKKVTTLNIESYTKQLDELNAASTASKQAAGAEPAKNESAEANTFDARACARHMFELTTEDYNEAETLTRINTILNLDTVTNEAELYDRALITQNAPEFNPAWKAENPELFGEKDGRDKLADLFECSIDQLGELLAEGSAPAEHQAVINEYLSSFQYLMSFESTIQILAILGDPKAFESDEPNSAQITKALETAIGIKNAKKITERLSFQVFLQRYSVIRVFGHSPEIIAKNTIRKPYYEKRSVYEKVRISTGDLNDYGQVYGIADRSEPNNHRTFFVSGFQNDDAGSLALTAALMQDGEDAVDLEKLYKDESLPLRIKAIDDFCDKNKKVAWLLNGKPVEGVIMQTHPHPTVDGLENLIIYGCTDGARLVVVDNDQFVKFGKATEATLGSPKGLVRIFVGFKKTTGKQLAVIVDKNFDKSKITNIDFSNRDAIPEGVIAVVDLNKYYEALHPTLQAEPAPAAPAPLLQLNTDTSTEAPAPAPRAPDINIDTPPPGPVPAPTPLTAVRMPAARSAGQLDPGDDLDVVSGPVADVFSNNESGRLVLNDATDELVERPVAKSGFGRKLALAGALLATAGAGTYGYEKYDAGKTDHVNLATGLVGEGDAIQKPKLMRDTVFELGSNETIKSIPKSFEITVHDFRLDNQMVVQLTDVDFAPTTEGQKLDMEALKTQLLRHGLTRDNKVFMEFADSKTGALQPFVSQEDFKPGAKGDQRLTMRALDAGDVWTIPRKVIPNTLFKIKFNKDGPEFVDNRMHYLPSTDAIKGETLAWKYQGINLDDAGTKTDGYGIASMRSVLLRDAINALPNSQKVVGSTCEVQVPIVIFQTFKLKKVPPPTPPSPPSQTK